MSSESGAGASKLSVKNPGYAGNPVTWTDSSADERIVEILASVLPSALRPLFDARFVRSCVLYDEYVYRLSGRVFRASGLVGAAREPGSVLDLAARAGLDPSRAVPIDWLLRELASRGVVQRLGDDSHEDFDAVRYRAIEPFPDLDPEEPLDAQRRHDPSWMPSYTVAGTVAGDYPAFLRGEMSGEDVLFSPERLGLWFDYFSNDHGLYAVNNRLGAIAVEQWMAPAGGTILELGGGLGSAALALLERLEGAGRLDAVERYRFTEIIPAFLRRGQRHLEGRYGSWGRLSYGRLDMDKPFEPQGVSEGSVSCVYAVNTLHVAHDLELTLCEIRRALKPGGALVLSECVRPFPGQPIYVELIFNLMESFRTPRLDSRFRPTGGFLTPEQWTEALQAAGFEDVRFLPDMKRVREHFSVFYVAALGARRSSQNG